MSTISSSDILYLCLTDTLLQNQKKAYLEASQQMAAAMMRPSESKAKAKLNIETVVAPCADTTIASQNLGGCIEGENSVLISSLNIDIVRTKYCCRCRLCLCRTDLHVFLYPLTTNILAAGTEFNSEIELNKHREEKRAMANRYGGQLQFTRCHCPSRDGQSG